jgi:RNA binding exosome subunit
MGPEDQHPWEREDEEIRQAFAEKNAEIQRLKKKNYEVMSANAALYLKIDKQAELASDLRASHCKINELWDDLQIQIKQVELWEVVCSNQKSLISELCDALSLWDRDYGLPQRQKDLVQRAREAHHRH